MPRLPATLLGLLPSPSLIFVLSCMFVSCFISLNAASFGNTQAALRKAPKGTELGIYLSPLNSDRALFERNTRKPLRLASVAKVFVSGAALLRLTPEFHFRTQLYGDQLQANSVRHFLIKGGGSPCFDEHFYPDNPNKALLNWVAELKKKGLTKITGDLIVDASLFAGPAIPSTYPSDHHNRQQWYSAPASAFAFLDNCIEVRVNPTQVGKSAQVQIRPYSPRIPINNRTKTSSVKRVKNVIVSRSIDSNRISVSGSYGARTSWFPLAIAESPNLLHADHFKTMLTLNGISVKGKVRLGTLSELEDPQLLHEQRDPLLPTLGILNTRSQNFYGEQILRCLGAYKGRDGSLHESLITLHHILDEELQLPQNEIALLDGCGLSYDNRASAYAVGQLLRRMGNSTYTAEWLHTLKEMKSENVTCKVKTGTLNIARCLAGYIPVDGELYCFAILLNRTEGANSKWRWDAKTLYKNVLAAMIRDLKKLH